MLLKLVMLMHKKKIILLFLAFFVFKSFTRQKQWKTKQTDFKNK